MTHPTDFLDRSQQQKIIQRSLSAMTPHLFQLKVDLRRGYLFEVLKERGIRVIWGTPLDHPNLPIILEHCAKAVDDIHRSSGCSGIRRRKEED